MGGWVNYLVFGWYPYVSLAFLLVGSRLRFSGDPHVRPDESGSLLARRHLTCGLVFFHFGILVLFIGHLVGLLTPISVFEAIGMSHGFKQTTANVVGGTAAAFAFVGVAVLLRRRLAEARRRPESLAGDVAIMLLVLVQLALGLASIAVAIARYGDGCGALPLMWWAESIATLNPTAAVGYIADMPLVFKLHIVNGLAIVLVLPFTRLVNMWSVPIWCLDRYRKPSNLHLGAAE